MAIYLQPAYLQGQLPNNSRFIWQQISRAEPFTELSVEDLITTIARRVYPGNTKEKPVKFAVEKFLRLTERQTRHLSKDDLSRKIDFLKLLASEDFISREGYECSEHNIVHNLALTSEYTAFNDKYERSEHRTAVQEFVRFVKNNVPANTRISDSFKRRAVMGSILNGDMAHMLSDLKDFIEAKIPGVFKLFNKLGEEYNFEHLQGISSELALAKTLQKQDFKITEFSHDFKPSDSRDGGEIDIVADKNGERFFFEVKKGDERIKSRQIRKLINYAKEQRDQEIAPILIINKHGGDINKVEIGHVLWRVGNELRPNLKIWDRDLVDITDNFQPIEPPPPVDKPVQLEKNL